MQSEIRPFFTILTASLNSAATMGQTLESIRSQRFQDFEHIVIDGGSRDGTLDILDDFRGSYPLLWKSEPDGGIADGLNKGICRARGKYILILQADDRLLSPDSLAKTHTCLLNGLGDFYVFPVLFEHPSKGNLLLKPIPMLGWNHFKFILRTQQGCFTHQRVFERIGKFRTDFSIAFDYDFFYRALMAHCTIRFEKFPVTVMGGGGISSSAAHLSRRLAEEYLVQMMNETRPVWRMAQAVFRKFYMPYKWITTPALRG